MFTSLLSSLTRTFAVLAGVAVMALSLSAGAGSASAQDAWLVRPDLNWAQYQADSKALVGQSYRLSHISGFGIIGVEHLAAIWTQSAGPAWEAAYSMTGAELQSMVDLRKSQGYRPVQIEGYDLQGMLRYAAIFVHDSAPWVARHGLTSAEYQAQVDALAAQGYRPSSVSGYTVNGEARFAPVWTPSGGGAWQARHNLTSDELTATVTTLSAQGYRPVHIDGYQVGTAVRYAAIFTKDGNGPWVARHGLTKAEYQAQADGLVAQGYRLSSIDAYTVGDRDVRYAAVWELN